ncbi:MAG: Gfo/Idh/MocA family protein [Boseongicola sp.]
MTIRYGLIGAGMMGQEHIRNIGLLDGCEVTAVADPNDGMRSCAIESSGGIASGFAEHNQLLSSGLCDALVIATPNDTHHSILLDAMATSLPILCEKPLCTTSADCRDILNKAATRTAPIWVGMEYRYMPPVQRLLQELQSGAAGSPKMVSIREHRFPFLEKVDHWNRFNERTGGTLVEKCCHYWDLMRETLQSDPVRVYASAGVDVNHQDEIYDGRIPDIFDNAFVIVDFANGTRGMLDICMFAEGSYWQEFISVTGDIARLDAKVPGPSRLSTNGNERNSEFEISKRAEKLVVCEEVKVDVDILAAGDHHGSTYYQHERFRDFVRAGNGQPEVTVLDGFWSVIVGEAAEQSARTGQPIEVSV